MTAADILTHWRKVAPVLKYKSTTWMILLTICERGPDGITRWELAEQCRARGRQGPGAADATLKKWETAGLIVSGTIPSTKSGPATLKLYTATPKLYAFLRIDPAAPAIGPQIIKEVPAHG